MMRVCVCVCLSILLAAPAFAADLEVITDEVGRPRTVKAKDYTPKRGPSKISEDQAKSLATDFVNKNKNLLGVSSADRELVTVTVKEGKTGHKHVRSVQTYKGVPVLGGEVIVHLDQDGEVYSATTKTDLNLPANFSKKSINKTATRKAAKKAALELAKDETAGTLRLRASFEGYEYVPARMFSKNATTSSSLAVKVLVENKGQPDGLQFSKTYYVDVLNGDVVFAQSNIEHLERHVYDCARYPDPPQSGYCYLDRVQYAGYCHGRSEYKDQGDSPACTGDPETPRGPHNRPTMPFHYGSTDVDDTFNIISDTHNFIQTTLGLDGANNEGGTGTGRTTSITWERTWTVALAHAEGGDQISGPMGSGAAGATCPHNAGFFHNSGAMGFCRDEVYEDVVGHEYGHALTHHMFLDIDQLPVGPVTVNETGALNEAYCDFTGEAFELFNTGSQDWINGSGDPLGVPFRNLADPSSLIVPDPINTPYPERYHDENFYCGIEDEGGIHINSTVITYSMYLAAMGGSFNGCDIAPIGTDAVQQIFDNAWRNYFTDTVTFNEAYTALETSCWVLYPSPDTTCDEFMKSLQAVELDQQGTCSGQPEVAPACAVNNIGTAQTCWPTGYLTTTFAPNEDVWIDGSGGVAGEEVDVHLVAHDPARPIWEEFSPIETHTATVQGDGTTVSMVTTAVADGTYDVLVDANQDGIYQPWADSVQTFTVETPVDGDGTCYEGQSYDTSENCKFSPQDCGCSGGYYCGVSQGEWQCKRRGGGGGCFLSGAQITMFDGSTKSVEEIEVGDKVRSIDEKTGLFIEGEVAHLIRAETEEYVILNGTTKVTPNHRFYVPNINNPSLMKTSLNSVSSVVLSAEERANGKWVEIGDLPVGTLLLDKSGKLIEIKSLKRVKEEHPVYNFEVQPEHNYVADGIVVHNRKLKMKMEDPYEGGDWPY